MGQISLESGAAAAAKLFQSCPTLCDPIDGLKVQEGQWNARQVKLNGVHWEWRPVLNELERSAVAVRGGGGTIPGRSHGKRKGKCKDSIVIRGVRKQQRGQCVCKGGRARVV